MTITLDTLAFLASPAGERTLARLTGDPALMSDAATLPLLTALRKDLPGEQAGAALELARLRVKACVKFGDAAAGMFFTRGALEQASDPLARRYRAERLRAQGHTHVADVCCGIGADALAFAAAGCRVTGADIDPLRVRMAQHNAAVLDVRAEFRVHDAREGLPAPAGCVFFDPARRADDGRRVFAVEQYDPPLSLVRGWAGRAVVVKLSPGVQLEQLAAYPGGVEFISVQGDLKEAVLWLNTPAPPVQASLLLPDGTAHTLTPAAHAAPPLDAPRGWLCEPDPAVLRAGLVGQLAAALDGHMLDETIAYFTVEHPPSSVWCRAWHIRDWMPFNLKKLRAYLREHNVGSVTVKKRGFPLMPEQLIPQLKLKGDNACTLVCTRLRGEHIVMVCDG